jgi:3-hydroxyisobutyrate dehydrogenase-like beta-hydroxyacid dehydrogenase
MDIGIIGLGRMGAGMAKRGLRHGHRVVVWGAADDDGEDANRAAYTHTCI